MELLTYMVQAHREGERAVWLVARLALDNDEAPELVADTLGVSVTTMYRKLREQGLTYGRGRVAVEPPRHGH